MYSMKDIWVSKCIELPVKVLTCWGVSLRDSITSFNLQIGKRSELPNTCQPRAAKCSMQVAMVQETVPSSPLAVKAMTLACASWVGHILLPAGPDTNINGNGKKMIKSIVSSDWVPPCHFIE